MSDEPSIVLQDSGVAGGAGPRGWRRAVCSAPACPTEFKREYEAAGDRSGSQALVLSEHLQLLSNLKRELQLHRLSSLDLAKSAINVVSEVCFWNKAWKMQALQNSYVLKKFGVLFTF